MREIFLTSPLPRLFLTLSFLFTGACEGPGTELDKSGEIPLPLTPITIDVRRSLAVTEQPILERFSLERVLGQLAAQSGEPGLTARQLFNQWWDTQNPGPGLGAGPHCDDNVDPALGSVINGYPYLCRPAPAEGSQVTCDPFTEPATSPCAYVPIGLFNRFDLAPGNGAHCGEYRIVYAKRTGMHDTADRNLLIFEAILENPQPKDGFQGCRPIVMLWANLSRERSIKRRAEVLERFYFEGKGSVPPVISIDHLGGGPLGAGQIRTNQFSQTTTGWSLREFKLVRSGGTRFVPVPDKNNAFGELFDPASAHPKADSFRRWFPSQVAALAAPRLVEIDINVPEVFNTAQSQASGVTASEMRYLERLGTASGSLRAALDAELAALGSTLTPDAIALRAQANSCAGCHRLNSNIDVGGGLIWPASLGFVHVSERDTETVEGITRFRISSALLDVFLPHRKKLIEDYLNHRPLPARRPGSPIGGRGSHG